MAATIHDYGTAGDRLNAPALGAPDGWCAAVTKELEVLAARVAALEALHAGD